LFLITLLEKSKVNTTIIIIAAYCRTGGLEILQSPWSRYFRGFLFLSLIITLLRCGLLLTIPFWGAFLPISNIQSLKKLAGLLISQFTKQRCI